MNVTVVALRIAPVKGLACVSRDAVDIGPDGVAEDRRLWLVTDRGRVVTQREHPELVQVVPDLDLASGTLTLRLPDGATVRDSVGHDEAALGEEVASRLFGKDRLGRVVAPEAAEALSRFAGERLRLMMSAEPGVGWDEGPVSLLARASVAEVGTPDDGDASRRYRMLIEVDGLPAYGEEEWVGQDLAIGTAVLHVSHVLGRCEVIRHSPFDGHRDWDGLRELARLRGPRRLDLGVIATVARAGRVAVGDGLGTTGG